MPHSQNRGHSCAERTTFQLSDRLKTLLQSATDCINPAQFLHDRYLPLDNAFDAVAHGSFDQANIAYQMGETLWLDRSRLIRSPHGTIERDMAFHYTSTQRHTRYGSRKPGFVAGISHRNSIALFQHGNNT